MGRINDFMSRHHKECDATLTRAGENAAAGDWAALERDTATFLKEIEHHIQVEEEQLFRDFEERSGMGEGAPTGAFRAEHEEMKGLFEQLRAAVAARNAAQFRTASETLLPLLQQHNNKEEVMLYVMFDETLGDDADKYIGQMQGALA